MWAYGRSWWHPPCPSCACSSARRARSRCRPFLTVRALWQQPVTKRDWKFSPIKRQKKALAPVRLTSYLINAAVLSPWACWGGFFSRSPRYFSGSCPTLISLLEGKLRLLVAKYNSLCHCTRQFDFPDGFTPTKVGARQGNWQLPAKVSLLLGIS